jgi:hypothetical protein
MKVVVVVVVVVVNRRCATEFEEEILSYNTLHET